VSEAVARDDKLGRHGAELEEQYDNELIGAPVSESIWKMRTWRKRSDSAGLRLTVASGPCSMCDAHDLDARLRGR